MIYKLIISFSPPSLHKKRNLKSVDQHIFGYLPSSQFLCLKDYFDKSKITFWVAWRDSDLLSLCSRNDPFSEGAYLCLSVKYREKSSPASNLTIIQYWLLIPGNFFQIGEAGDYVRYLNLYLATTQEILEVLQWKQSLGGCYKTIFTRVMRAENAPELPTDLVVEGTRVELCAGTALLPPLWYPAGHQNATSLGCAGFLTGMWLQLMVWPCHSDHIYIWQEFLVASKHSEHTEGLQCILER